MGRQDKEQPVALVITSAGAVTAVGNTAPSTSAAVRAGIAGFNDLEGISVKHGGTVAGAKVGWLGTSPRLNRLLSMAASALREALGHIPKERLSRNPLDVHLICGDMWRPGEETALRSWLVSLGEELGTPITIDSTGCGHGQAAVVRCIASARAQVVRKPNALQALLAVDSLIDLKSLAWLEKRGRLKGDGHPRGVIPGEAAACVILEHIEYSGDRSQLYVAGLGQAYEEADPFGDGSYMVDGLTRAVRTALEEAEWGFDQDLAVWADLNGEGWRAHEWMIVCTRLLGSVEVYHPADCVGDVGAAAAGLLLMLASDVRRYMAGSHPRRLMLTSSEGGLRGCLALLAG